MKTKYAIGLITHFVPGNHALVRQFVNATQGVPFTTLTAPHHQASSMASCYAINTTALQMASTVVGLKGQSCAT